MASIWGEACCDERVNERIERLQAYFGHKKILLQRGYCNTKRNYVLMQICQLSIDSIGFVCLYGLRTRQLTSESALFSWYLTSPCKPIYFITDLQNVLFALSIATKYVCCSSYNFSCNTLFQIHFTDVLFHMVSEMASVYNLVCHEPVLLIWYYSVK